ncbi:Zinc finger, C2H2 domain and DNA binding HTH domain, Psq-type and Homeodomain-like-containing protein [Strongyloides ratti]|uniref:Zinc finger, C2H2 domain and DNA binding HTH domain, Psq-type and Homeodomain-like-containing protein n=1 Tax=Strongyloides ratti TaxID=34506 RepID=A0A090L9E4_STRRB|nr:Zinc finger, C2H2 domain and DNA binding HTH domain, Psq-type and Homeodomain-like-containing protein [Strongyloides ratti]CEF64728.1 Zinc finger, C2H2 domain and DNA binding HTH domain, Psq-type and Homeodomain-like-containing protein [Strongyloides ratti]
METTDKNFSKNLISIENSSSDTEPVDEWNCLNINDISIINQDNNNIEKFDDTVQPITTLSSKEPSSNIITVSGSNEPERRKKKPYKELTLEEKVQLIRLAEENSGLSQASIAEKYTIAKSNVCRILQRKHEYIRAYESAGFAGSRKRKLRGDNTENLSINSSKGKTSFCNNINSDNETSLIQSNLLKDLALKNCLFSNNTGILKPIPINPFTNHLKSSTNQNIESNNETLRAHMYKQHQISRMFMCKCCNWAFPDKTSLHMHQQAKEEGKNVNVPVIGKGNTPSLSTAATSLLGLSTNNGQSLQNTNPFNSLNNFANLTTTLNLHNTLSSDNNNGNNLLPHLQILQNNEFINKFKDGLLLNNMLPHIGIQNWFAAAMSAAATTNQSSNQNNFNILTQDGILNQPLDLEKALQGLEECSNNSIRKDNHKIDDNNLHKNDNNDVDLHLHHHSASSSSAKSSPSPISIEAGGTGSYYKHDDHRTSNDTPLNITADNSDHVRQNVHSGVSPSETNSSISPSTDNGSNNNCYDCSLYKSKLAVAENRCRYLEESMNTLQNESLRYNTRASITESTCRQLEIDSRVIREQNEILRQKLAECQDKILSFMQTTDFQNPVSITNLLNEVIKATIIQ